MWSFRNAILRCGVYIATPRPAFLTGCVLYGAMRVAPFPMATGIQF